MTLQANNASIRALEFCNENSRKSFTDIRNRMKSGAMDKATLVTKNASAVKLGDWGYPGHLTEEEFVTFETFRDEVFSAKRDDNFRSTVFSFEQANEQAPYALCRWLRARKYNLADTIKMVEEATECTGDPRKNDFFPSSSKALQVEESLYIKQYPQLYYGHAHNGCPVFISQPGMLNIDAIGLLTSLPSIINFHWHAMMHQFSNKLKEEQISSNGDFKRYECVCILDLAGLTASQLGKREMNLVKVQAAIDSLCFPETLNKMVIVNAPTFFTFTWKLIRGWIDARTSAKVDVIGTNQAKLLKKLSTIIDPKQLPSDYGGSGVGIKDSLETTMLATGETIREIGSTLKLESRDCEMLPFKGSKNVSLVLGAGQIAKVSFITRTSVGCKIIVEESSSGKVLGTIDAKHDGDDEDNENELPSRYDLFDKGVLLEGKGTFDVKMFSAGNKRKNINVMMVTNIFVGDEAKISSIETTTTKAEEPQAGTDVNKNASICTGVFSPNDHKKLTITESPGRRRIYNTSKIDRPATSSRNTSATSIETMEGLHNDTYAVVPNSPVRVSSKNFCGLISSPCD